MRTRRRPGAWESGGRGGKGGRGAPGNGPRPPPAFERATQGARRRFKSKRPAARPPSRVQAGWGDKGAPGHPSRPGPRVVVVWGRQPRGRLGKLGRG